MPTEQQLIAKLERAKTTVERAAAELLDHKQKNMRLKCTADACGSNKGCGAEFAPIEATYVRTHWYTQPYSCTEGDYWNVGDGEVICPKCGAWTRLYRLPEFNKKEYLFKTVATTHANGCGPRELDKPKEDYGDY